MLSGRLLNVGRRILSSGLSQNLPQNIRNESILASNIEFLKTPTIQADVCKDVIDKVNQKVHERSEGRLFAVVQLCGKQYKVTAGDIVIVEGYWPPKIGDRLRLEKVLVAGGDDFTLIGRPLVQPSLVDVQATVIENAIAHTRTVFRKKPKKQYMNIKFHRSSLTMIRINSIDVTRDIDHEKRSLLGQNIYQ